MRRSLACLCSCLLVTATAINFAQTADAAVTSPGTVTIAYNPGPMTYTITPASISGTVGDTFTLANTLTSGNSSSSYSLSLQDDTGSVSLLGTACTANASCQVLDLFAGTATGTFTIAGTGSVKVMRNYNNVWSQLGTLAIGSGGSSSTASATTQYTFTYLLPNGTQCGAISPRTVDAGPVTLPQADADCSVPGYMITSWTPIGSEGSFAPGATVIASGDQTFTAALVDNRFPIQYDSNLDIMKQCVSANGSTSPAQISSLPSVGFVESAEYTVLVPLGTTSFAPLGAPVFFPRTGPGSGNSVNGAVDQNGLSAGQVQLQYEDAENALFPATGPVGSTGTRPVNASIQAMSAAIGLADLTIDGVLRQHTVIAQRGAVKLLSTAPCTPIGKKLVGWSTRGDGTGNIYLPGATIASTDVADSTGLHLYAVWGNEKSGTANPKSQALIDDIAKSTEGMDPAAKTQYISDKITAYASEPDAELWVVLYIIAWSGLSILEIMLLLWLRIHKKPAHTINHEDSSSSRI